MVRYGIVGFGLHAVKRMVPGFRGAKSSQLIALSRRNLEKAREAGLRYDVPLTFDSVEDLCRHPEVDAVFVATPNVCHLNDVLTAARHGKAILCEKPMAMNAAECRKMVDEARAAGVKLGVAQVFRFEHSVLHIRHSVATKELGQVLLARAEFAYPGRNHARTWINDRNIGGGTVADVGVHCIDALRFVLQDEVVRVQALTASDAESGDVDCSGALIMQFSRGTLATVMVTMRADYRTPLELVGSNGVLSADNAFTVDSPLNIDIRRKSKLVQSWSFRNADAYSLMLDSFSDWVEGKGDFVAPGEEGLRNQLIVDAAYESARTGGAVHIADSLVSA